jgi:hypothetical protein
MLSVKEFVHCIRMYSSEKVCEKGLCLLRVFYPRVFFAFVGCVGARWVLSECVV